MVNQPWFVESGDVHGNGNLIIFPDGHVQELGDFLSVMQKPEAVANCSQALPVLERSPQVGGASRFEAYLSTRRALLRRSYAPPYPAGNPTPPAHPSHRGRRGFQLQHRKRADLFQRVVKRRNHPVHRKLVAPPR